MYTKMNESKKPPFSFDYAMKGARPIWEILNMTQEEYIEKYEKPAIEKFRAEAEEQKQKLKEEIENVVELGAGEIVQAISDST